MGAAIVYVYDISRLYDELLSSFAFMAGCFLLSHLFITVLLLVTDNKRTARLKQSRVFGFFMRHLKHGFIAYTALMIFSSSGFILEFPDWFSYILYSTVGVSLGYMLKTIVVLLAINRLMKTWGLE